MNKRAVILLLICFVLAAATVTLRYIESEKEKIKAQFVPPPRVEPKRVTNVTTTAYLSQEEPGGEEALPAGEQPGTVPPVEKGTILPEGKQDASEGETPRGIDPRSQRMERGELREPSMPPITEEPAAQEGDSAVDEEVVTPLDEEVPAQPAAGERVPDEETDAEPEEDVADERDEPDDESAKEAGSEDEEDVSPGLESEITSDKDEQIPPEELGEEGEVEEGEYVEGEEEGEPFEEGLEGEEDEIAGEEEGEEVMPSEEEESLCRQALHPPDLPSPHRRLARCRPPQPG